MIRLCPPSPYITKKIQITSEYLGRKKEADHILNKKNSHLQILYVMSKREFFMYYNKVEICGVNTSKLKVLTDEEKRDLLV